MVSASSDNACVSSRFVATLHLSVTDLKAKLTLIESRHQAAIAELQAIHASALAAVNAQSIASAAVVTTKIDALTERVTELTSRYARACARDRVEVGACVQQRAVAA
jgi:hypothetical protein